MIEAMNEVDQLGKTVVNVDQSNLTIPVDDVTSDQSGTTKLEG